jgi:hypothetical protein
MSQSDELQMLNSESLNQFRTFLSSLSDSDLTAQMPAGWTVSAVLCHLAFWDKRALVLLDKWEKEGIEISVMDTDVVNEVVRLLCLAVPARSAVQIFLRTAEEVDHKIAGLDSARAIEILEKGKNVHLQRADHRWKHLEEIRAVLGK